jgi:hypothetical protein
MNDDRQQHVSGVAVEMFGARLEVELRLAREHGKHVALGDDVVGRIAGKRRQRQVVT